MFPLAEDCWKHLNFQLIENGGKAVIHKRASKCCIRLMKFGLKHASSVNERNWGHIRLETSPQIGALQLVLGLCCKMGMTKERPSKRNGFEIALNARDSVSIVEASSSETKFLKAKCCNS